MSADSKKHHLMTKKILSSIFGAFVFAVLLPLGYFLHRKLEAMGRSLLAMQGIHVTGKWWTGKTWAMIGSDAPAWVVERLKIYLKLIEPVEAEERKLTEQVQEAARDQKVPKGVGPLSFEVLRREVGDWSRFNNYPALRARSAVKAPPIVDAAIAAGAVSRSVELYGPLPTGAQQRGQATGWQVNKSGN